MSHKKAKVADGNAHEEKFKVRHNPILHQTFSAYMFKNHFHQKDSSTPPHHSHHQATHPHQHQQ
jgi:hypothetical protein